MLWYEVVMSVAIDVKKSNHNSRLLLVTEKFSCN